MSRESALRPVEAARRLDLKLAQLAVSVARVRQHCRAIANADRGRSIRPALLRSRLLRFLSWARLSDAIAANLAEELAPGKLPFPGRQPPYPPYKPATGERPGSSSADRLPPPRPSGRRPAGARRPAKGAR